MTSGKSSFPAIVGHNLDVVVCLLALPLFIALDWPLAGWGAATFAWVVGRLLQHQLESRAAVEDDHRMFFRYMAGSLIGRSWLLALAVFAVGIVDRPSGLAAALLALAVFTVYLATSLFTHRPLPGTQAVV